MVYINRVYRGGELARLVLTDVNIRTKPINIIYLDTSEIPPDIHPNLITMSYQVEIDHELSS